MNFDEIVEAYHEALAEFTKSNPEPIKALLSQKNDQSAAGGFGGFTHGVEQVRKNWEFASTQFHEGRVSFTPLSKVATDDLGYIVEVERYDAKLFGGDEMGVSIIRVTTIFRREEGGWKVIHRHGDPLPAIRAIVNAIPYSVVSIQKTM